LSRHLSRHLSRQSGILEMLSLVAATRPKRTVAVLAHTCACPPQIHLQTAYTEASSVHYHPLGCPPSSPPPPPYSFTLCCATLCASALGSSRAHREPASQHWPLRHRGQLSRHAAALLRSRSAAPMPLRPRTPTRALCVDPRAEIRSFRRQS
jgi:hypothetical protein